jgi:hypothetical protein
MASDVHVSSYHQIWIRISLYPHPTRLSAGQSCRKDVQIRARSTDCSPPRRVKDGRRGRPKRSVDVFSTEIVACERHPSGRSSREAEGSARVAIPEPLEPSRRLVQAAAAERGRLLVELEKTQARAAELRRTLNLVEASAQQLKERLTLLEDLAGDVPDDEIKRGSRTRPRLVTRRTEPPKGWLRGALIRQVAVRILASSGRSRRPIHYTDWLRLVEDAGYGVSGRDPAATFLTQVGRSSVVARGEQPGTYLLDFDTIAPLRERLALLNDELTSLHHGQQTIEEIASLRERRAELVNDISSVERALEEAIEALGFETAH